MFMKWKILSLLIPFYLLMGQLSNAQQDDSVDKDKVQFKLGAFHNSNLNYYGRTDSLRSSGFFPIGELWFSGCFYLNAAPVFVSNSAGSFAYAGTISTAGYQSKSKNEKILTHIYFTKPFYKSGSQLVQSALKEQLTASFSWQNKYLNLTVSGDIKHSDKFDYGIAGGLDHVFRYELPGQFILVIDPSAYVYSGTQQFIKTTYEKRNFLILPGTEQAVNKQVSRLNILSYELSSPVILARNHWQIILVPAYVIPQNVVVVENRPDLSERGKRMLYITAGAKVIF